MCERFAEGNSRFRTKLTTALDDRGASVATNAQPKSVAIAGDSTVFVIEADGIEAVRSNQKLQHFPTKFTPSAIAASGTNVAVGGEV